MSWVDYYKLLLRYHGDLSMATKGELRSASHNNPNDPVSALKLARKKYAEHKKP